MSVCLKGSTRCTETVKKLVQSFYLTKVLKRFELQHDAVTECVFLQYKYEHNHNQSLKFMLCHRIFMVRKI